MNPRQATALLFIFTFLYVTVLIFQPGVLTPLPNILSWSYSEHIDDPYGHSARPNLALNISANTGTPLLNFKDLGGNKAKVLLLVIVSTAPQRFARRQAIRDTWWKHCTGGQVKLQKTGKKRRNFFLHHCKTSWITMLRVLPPKFEPVLQQTRLWQVVWLLTSDWIKLRGSRSRGPDGSYVTCWKASLPGGPVHIRYIAKSTTTFRKKNFATCYKLIVNWCKTGFNVASKTRNIAIQLF